MNEGQLEAELSSLPLGGLRYYDSIGSTNDEAQMWVSRGAPDLSLVVADEQRAGRGRGGSRWLTPAGTALAFSLILRPSAVDVRHTTRISGLGALAMAEACLKFGLHAAIKWPNDVLLSGSKVGGVLVESIWSGNALEASVLGIGMNILSGSVPPESEVSYPATSIESELGHPIERIAVLKEILLALIRWRENLGADEFMRTWEGLLAFRGQEVTVASPDEEPVTGTLLGLANDGSARLRINSDTKIIQAGEMHLRPARERAETRR
jgi:BirA family biotin operon repressor/biotin-[acetyl-CoA-carboxylase] ligase